jgi:hypothetical protein
VNVQDVIDGLFSGNPQQAPAEASVDYVALANVLIRSSFGTSEADNKIRPRDLTTSEVPPKRATKKVVRNRHGQPRGMSFPKGWGTNYEDVFQAEQRWERMPTESDPYRGIKVPKSEMKYGTGGRAH